MINDKNLIELFSVEPLNYTQINDYLNKLNLPPNPPERLTEEWALRNERDQDIFKIACQKNDIRLFKILLDYDFPIPNEFNQTGLNNEIIGLLTSRGSWQRTVQAGGDGILFNRTSALVEMAIDNIKNEVGEAILVMGETGAGKSTLTNFIAGIDYKKIRTKLFKLREEDHEIAKIGETSSSETLFPSGYKLNNLGDNTLWVDMPGMQETSGHVREIAAAIGTNILTNQVKKIKSIFLVCPWGKIDDSKFLGYRSIAEKIGRIIDSNPALSKHVVLVVSKPPTEGLMAKDVAEKLNELWTNELSRLNDNTPLIDHSYQAKLAIKRVTKIFIEDTAKIIITDVTKPEHREQIKSVVSTLPDAIPHTAFNFKDYHELVARFNQKITYFKNQIDLVLDKTSALKAEIANLTTQRERIFARQQKHEIAYQNWKIKKAKLQEGIDIKERIEENKKSKANLHIEIEKNKTQIALITQEREHTAVLLEKLQHKISTLQDCFTKTSGGLQVIKEKTQKENNQFIAIYTQILKLYEHTLSQIQKISEAKLEQFTICEQREQNLNKEKIEIEAIKTEAGNDIDEHIKLEKESCSLAKTEIEALNVTFEEQKTSLTNNEFILSMNEEFSAKINLLTNKLGWDNKINVTYTIDQLPIFHHATENRSNELNNPTLSEANSLSLH